MSKFIGVARSLRPFVAHGVKSSFSAPKPPALLTFRSFSGDSHSGDHHDDHHSDVSGFDRVLFALSFRPKNVTTLILSTPTRLFWTRRW